MSIWQTKAWGDMLLSSKQAEKIFEIEWIFIEKRKVSMWEYWLFIIGLEKFIDKKIIGKLIELCKRQKALFIQIESINYSKKTVFDKVIFKKWKPSSYKKFIMPYTALIDLNLSQDDILASMKPKGRYNIKLASKKWVEVSLVEKTSENIKEFYDLMEETTTRDWFSWNTLSYYESFLNLLPQSKLFLAYYDEKVIAGGIFVFEKDVAIYYYWASTWDSSYRNLMAPYLLQWEAIKYAKEIGCSIYDFLWVSTPWDTNSTLAWVTKFKKKLTKDIRWVSDSYIFVNKKLKYLLISTLKKLKR